MDEAIRQLEENGLYDTAIQLKRDIKANKLKPYHAEQLANDLIRALKKLNKEEKKEPFAYPSKQVDRSKVIKSNPVDQKVLQRFVNKMMIAKNLDQANKENLFPNIDHVSNMKVDQDVTIEHESDTSAVFKPSSLDGPKRDPKFEIYKNRAYDKDSSYPASEKSSLPNKSGLESFAHHPKSQVNTSKANESFKEKIRSSGNAIGGIHKVEETFVGDTSSILKGIDPPEEKLDTYDDDEDQGFFIIEAAESDFLEKCKLTAAEYNFPEATVKPPDEQDKIFEKERMKKLEEERRKEDETMKKKKKKEAETDKDKLKQALGQVDDKDEESETGSDDSIPTQLPKWVKFMPCEDEFYPAEYNSTVYDCYNLKVVFDREKTGFEETREFPIVTNSVIAGRYQVMEFLGQAAFSKAIRCYDLHKGEEVCMKIIENNKDYYDQSIDEIKLLRYINVNCKDVDDENVIGLIDYFYHKEHLFIVTELLKDNLYEFYKYNREKEDELYFTLGRLQKITKQILIALDYIHGLHLIHCDLKPENILVKSYSQCKVKVIDFGSSCFLHDHLSSYVQSRSYRAPEVILGCRYDYKIDIWSLGCIVAELFSGYVIFQNDSVQGLLARVLGIIGPIPEYMMKEGKLVSNFFTREGIIYQEAGDGENTSQSLSEPSHDKKKKPKGDGSIKINLLVPKQTSLKHRLHTDDLMFVDFIRCLLQVDPCRRPSAKEALAHPWLTETKYPDDD